MNLYYNCNGAKGDTIVSDKNPRPVDDGTPAFRNIHYSHISAVDVKIAAGFFYGLAEIPLRDISLTDISVPLSGGGASSYPEMADDIPDMVQAGFFIRNAQGLRFNHVHISGQVGPAFDIDDSVQIDVRP